MNQFLIIAFALAMTSCVTVNLDGQTGDTATGTSVVQKTAVTCKTTADGWGKSCYSETSTCANLDENMRSCCGDTTYVLTASCNAQ
jgi:hypothetical protein